MRPQDSTPVEAVQIPLRARDGSVRAYAIVDAEDTLTLSQWHWSLHGRGYACRHQMIDGVQRTIFLHRQILGLVHGDGMNGDHKNRNRLDCRRANLRPATKHGNRQNVPSREGTSAYRGVSLVKATGKWEAYVNVNGKKSCLGYFADEHDAGAAARAARQRVMPYALD